MKTIAVLVGWHLLSTVLSAQDSHLGPVTDIAVSSNQVFSVSQGGVYQNHGSQLKRLFRPPFRVTSLVVVGDRLLLGGGDPGVSGMVGLYDLRGGNFHSVQVSDDLIYDVAVHPGKKMAGLACADNRVMTIALPSLAEDSLQERYRHTAVVRAVTFSPSGDYLASAGLDALVMLLPFDGLSKPIPIQDHSSKVDCLVFSPDATLLASGARDGKIRLHNLEGRLVRTYTGISVASADSIWEGHAYILSLAWGGSSSTLFAAAAQGSIYQLSTADNQWKKLAGKRTKPIYSLAFSATDELMVGTHTVQPVADLKKLEIGNRQSAIE